MTIMTARRAAARVAASGIEMPLLQFGQYLLDAHSFAFHAPGARQVSCTRLEFQVLSSLLQARGRPVSIERLMQRIYGGSDDEPDVTCLRVVISKIRKKLRGAGIDDPIVCENRVGYRIRDTSAEVEVLVFDRPRMDALDAVLSFASSKLPEAVALLRRHE